MHRGKSSSRRQKDRCAGFEDRFGQRRGNIPSVLGRPRGPDRYPEKSKSSVMMAKMSQMDKIDIKRLQEAYEQG